MTDNETKTDSAAESNAYRGKRVFRNGAWEDGSATPELLRADLRELPSEWVTKDESDQAKVHSADPVHIVQALVQDQMEKEHQGEQKSLDFCPVKLNFATVTLERLKALRNLSSMFEHGLCGFTDRFHVWFPKPHNGEVEFRRGPCPMPGKRPAHLRDLNLGVSFSESHDILADAERCRVEIEAEKNESI
jgi:hypothetical protein